MELLDEFVNIAKPRGLDMEAAFAPEPKVPVIESLTSFRYEQEGRRLLTSARAQQQNDFAQLLESPFKTKLSVVGSRPSDLVARQFAVMAFQCAILEWVDAPIEMRKGKTPPLWHRVWGGHYDTLRDSKEKPPAFIVISNIAENSTREKIEKVRDIIVKYCNVPKLLVISGKSNPAEFVMDNLFVPVNSFFYLTPKSKEREI